VRRGRKRGREDGSMRGWKFESSGSTAAAAAAAEAAAAAAGSENECSLGT